MSQEKCRRRYILAYPTQFLVIIRLVPGNVVMVATDMYGKSSYGSGYTELRESMTFLPFLFSYYDNFCYIYFPQLFCHLLMFYFQVKVNKVNMCTIFLFIRVLIFFVCVYNSNRYGTATASGKEFSMASIYDFQSLRFVIEGFFWDALAGINLFFYIFLV